MQSQPLNTVSSTHSPQGYSTVLATIAAVCAILALPFALIPFAGLAASMLVLGFISALAIWTRKKRALIGTGIAFLAMVISIISAVVALGAILNSRDHAVQKLAQIETQLQAAKAQAANASEKSFLGEVIHKLDTNNELTSDQAQLIGKVGESIINWAVASSSPTPPPANQ